MTATQPIPVNHGLSPEFVTYRDEAKAMFAAAGITWNVDTAQSVVRMFRQGYSLIDLAGCFVLNMPVQS